MDEERNGCPACKSSSTSQLFLDVEAPLLEKEKLEAIQITWFLCLCCGLAFKTPRPTEAEARAYYSKFSYSGDAYPERLKNAKEFIAGNMQRIGVDMAELDAIDIGSKNGQFLPLLGMGGENVDVNPQTSKVSEGWIGDGPYRGKPHDFVVLSHVLEHVVHPAQFLDGIVRDMMKISGFIYIEVPSLELPCRELFQKAHLQAYTGGGLTCAAINSGLNIISCAADEAISGFGVVRMLAARIGGYRAAVEAHIQSVKSRSNLDAALSIVDAQGDNGSWAFYGASEGLLRMLSKRSDFMPRRVFDLYKHGKTIHGCIVESPWAIEVGEVKRLLVTAASPNMQVDICAYLRENYPSVERVILFP